MELRTGELFTVDVDVNEVFTADGHLTGLPIKNSILARPAADMLSATVEGKQHQEPQKAHSAEVAHVHEAVVKLCRWCTVEFTTYAAPVRNGAQHHAARGNQFSVHRNLDAVVPAGQERIDYASRIGLVGRFSFGNQLIGAGSDGGVKAQVTDIQAEAIVYLNNVCRDRKSVV